MTALRDRLYQNPIGPSPAPGSLRPVVYLPTWLEWDVMRQRPQYLLDALAGAGHDVYFVQPTARAGSEPRSGVHVAPSLRQTPRSDVLVYTHFAPTRTLIPRYERAVVVYDILDDLSIFDPDEAGLPEERTVRYHHLPLMEAADLVIASNTVLVERHQQERPDVLLVENGVDPNLFTPHGDGVDLGARPVVGYHGAISSWFDFDLVREVAAARQDYLFVIVGPVMDGGSSGMSELVSLGNVVHHPQVPADRVAAYVRSFDVGLIPFVVDTMTEGVTPLKMYEYLASAVPVVSTPLPACVSHPDVATATSGSDVAAALDVAIAMPAADRHELRQGGLEASWARRIEPLLARLDELGLRTVGG